MQLGIVLRRWRIMSELTVREAARQMGIGASTLCRIENGELMDGQTLALILNWLTAKGGAE